MSLLYMFIKLLAHRKAKVHANITVGCRLFDLFCEVCQNTQMLPVYTMWPLAAFTSGNAACTAFSLQNKTIYPEAIRAASAKR